MGDGEAGADREKGERGRGWRKRGDARQREGREGREDRREGERERVTEEVSERVTLSISLTALIRLTGMSWLHSGDTATRQCRRCIQMTPKYTHSAPRDRFLVCNILVCN